MSSKTRSLHPNNVLEHLTRPSEKITGQTQRQQARALATLSLALLMCLPITLPVWLISMPEFTAVPIRQTKTDDKMLGENTAVSTTAVRHSGDKGCFGGIENSQVG